METPQNRMLVLAAFAAIYLVWGSSYLAILWAIQDVPPFLMAGLRFLLAGLLMVAWARARGASWPDRGDLAEAFLVGTLMLAGGNGAVSLGESKMPSGVAALLVAMVPIWVVVFEAVGARRLPRLPVLAGVGLGVAGVGLLSTVDAGWRGGEVDPWFILMIVAGSAAWAYGSLRSRRSRIESLRMRSGVQMLGGALSFAVLSFGRAETVAWGDVGTRAWLSMAFLVLFGSVLAFTSYIWLLRHVPAPAVATYAFVNPVVALVLGVALANEVLTLRSGVAAAFIVAAVVVINRASRTPVPPVVEPVPARPA